MSVQTEISRLESAKEAIATAIAGKGVTVPDGTMLDGMAALIESIEAGGGGSSGATLQVATGTFTPTSEVLGDNPITVTGVGFRPQILYIRHDDEVININSTIHLLTQGKYYLLSVFKTEEYQKTMQYYFSSSTNSRVIYTKYDNYVTVSLNDDGFTLSTEIGRYIVQRKYLYIAFG